MAEEAPIPGPPGLPFVGNVADINSDFPLGSICDIASKYGDIFQMSLGGRNRIFVGTQALSHEVCDESRFEKDVAGALTEVANGVHDGLFTAPGGNTNWGIAHRILMPAFGPISIQGMFAEMHEISAQLTLKWARHGSQPIMVTDDFTRLTLDTLALCTMGFRFNSYYHDDMHPFIEAMGDFLVESSVRQRRPGFASVFYRNATQKYWADIDVLRKTAEDVLKEGKANPTGRKDLLYAMLQGVDKVTGQKMTDSSIIDNLITFLIAGHETTSGLLSFAFYYLIAHPEAYRKAQKEVDDLIGTGPITVEHLSKLPYLDAVLRETLRISATIPMISLKCKDDSTLLGGKYRITKEDSVVLLLTKIQRDPKVFGADADQFVPERMLEENFNKLMKEYPDSWKPFGNGLRGCIGRPFAWQETKIVMAMLLQNFNFFYDDPNYTLSIKQTMTIKPKSFYMRAVLRNGLTATELEHRLVGGMAEKPKMGLHVNGGAAKNGAAKGKPLSIYYGSNTGTCEALAQRLASDALSHGFVAETVEPLDAANENLPKDRPVVIITASYEGNPPDNAGLFVNWVDSLKAKELEGVSYSVFGCGHHDWAQTFHRIPKLVDTAIDARGGERLTPIGLTDAANGEMFSDFEQWEDDVFWPAMEEKYGVDADAEHELSAPTLKVEFSSPRSSTLRQDVKESFVVDTKVLTAPGAPPKKHMEIQLPSDVSYRAGDYLAVLPLNPKEIVARVMRRFQLAWDAAITIEAQGRTTLPTNGPVSVSDVLGAYVELAQPATKRSILVLAEAVADEDTKAGLKSLAGDDYTTNISRKRVSLLDLLERFPKVQVPFSTFLALLPPMRVRQYSISSSPLWNPSHVTITYSLLAAPSLSNPDQQHMGVASSYLASLVAGDKVNVGIRPSVSAFHLPTTVDKTPIICVAAGSGIAPFHGFIQERAAQIGAGRKLAPALLFFGCRGPELDDLYYDEFERWQAMGAVDVRRAYSRVDLSSPAAAAAKGCKHVHDRLAHDWEELAGLWEQGAKVYVCGSREVGENVKQVILRKAKEGLVQMGPEVSEEDARERVEKWFNSIRNERYATDVFD